MPGMHQHGSVMEDVWANVDDKYDSQCILGRPALQILMMLVARASHHEFPYGMSVMANLCSSTNGATTEAFLGVHSLVVLLVFSMNDPQTRKCSGLAVGNIIAHALDQTVLNKAKDCPVVILRGTSQEAAAAPTIQIQFSCLTRFTESASVFANGVHATSNRWSAAIRTASEDVSTSAQWSTWMKRTNSSTWSD